MVDSSSSWNWGRPVLRAESSISEQRSAALAMLAGADRVRQFRKPGFEPPHGHIDGRFESGGPFLGVAVVPFGQFRRQLQQTGQTVGPFETGARLSPHVFGFAR